MRIVCTDNNDLKSFDSWQFSWHDMICIIEAIFTPGRFRKTLPENENREGRKNCLIKKLRTNRHKGEEGKKMNWSLWFPALLLAMKYDCNFAKTLRCIRAVLFLQKYLEVKSGKRAISFYLHFTFIFTAFHSKWDFNRCLSVGRWASFRGDSRRISSSFTHYISFFRENDNLRPVWETGKDLPECPLTTWHMLGSYQQLVSTGGCWGRRES